MLLLVLLAGSYWVEKERSPQSSAGRQPPHGYQAALIDSKGLPTSLSTFQGQWLVVLFGFVSCPDICPTHLAYLSQELGRMQSAQDGMAVQAKEAPIRGVFISVDPHRDTPTHLEAYRQHFDKGRNLLVAMTGSVDQLQQVAKSYGAFFQYRRDQKEVLPEGDYDVAHSTGFFIIDPKGQLVSVMAPPIAQGELTDKILNAQRKI